MILYTQMKKLHDKDHCAAVEKHQCPSIGHNKLKVLDENNANDKKISLYQMMKPVVVKNTWIRMLPKH